MGTAGGQQALAEYRYRVREVLGGSPVSEVAERTDEPAVAVRMAQTV